ncbi:unnamed protein product [Rhizophagus irregularis]|nr:unnamed protein product [Rhizophagus irregularis]
MHITGYNPFGDELRLKPIGDIQYFVIHHLSEDCLISFTLYKSSRQFLFLWDRALTKKKTSDSLALFNYKRGCYKKSAALVSPLFVYLFLCYNDE